MSETINARRTACRAFSKVSVIIVGKFSAGMFLQHIINTFYGSRGIGNVLEEGNAHTCLRCTICCMIRSWYACFVYFVSVIWRWNVI